MSATNVWFQQGVVWDLRLAAHEGFRQVIKHAKAGVFVTSGREGNHHPDSLHYLGLAWDMRHCGYTKDRLLEVLPGGGLYWRVVSRADGFHVECAIEHGHPLLEAAQLSSR